MYIKYIIRYKTLEWYVKKVSAYVGTNLNLTRATHTYNIGLLDPKHLKKQTLPYELCALSIVALKITVRV